MLKSSTKNPLTKKHQELLLPGLPASLLVASSLLFPAIYKQLSIIIDSKEDPYFNELRLDEVETCKIKKPGDYKNQPKALLAYWKY